MEFKIEFCRQEKLNVNFQKTSKVSEMKERD